jgi:hypothetical protein
LWGVLGCDIEVVYGDVCPSSLYSASRAVDSRTGNNGELLGYSLGIPGPSNEVMPYRNRSTKGLIDMKSAQCSVVPNALKEMEYVDKVVVTEVILDLNQVVSLLRKPGVCDSR